MKLAYLITEHKETALILKHLLPQHLVQVTEIFAPAPAPVPYLLQVL